MVAWPLAGVVFGTAKGPAPRGSLPPALLVSAPLHQLPGLRARLQRQEAPPRSPHSANRLSAHLRLCEFAGSARGQAASVPEAGRASPVTQRGRRPSFSQERRALGPRDAPSSAVSVTPFSLVTRHDTPP